MRAVAIGQAELKLFWRNRTALFNSLLLPLLLVPVLISVDAEGIPLVVGLIGFALLMAVYYNLVTTFVARREELVLKRLRVGELTDPEILLGASLPSVVVALGQMVLYCAVVGVVTGVAVPTRPWFLLLGVLAGTAVFVLLAAVSSAFTRTVEMAQVTSLPILMACLFGSGLMFPLSALPSGLASVLEYLPLTPVLELLRAGWADGPVLQPLIVLAVWIVLGTYAVQRWFRWDPPEVNLLGWWRSRGSAARFDLFVRWTFYLAYVVLPPLLIIGIATEVSTTAFTLIVAAALIQTVLGFRLTHLGIEHHLGRAPFPRRLLVIFLAVTGAVLVAGEIAFPTPPPGKADGPAEGIAVMFLILTITALSAVLRPRTLVLAALAGGVFMFLTSSPGQALFITLMLQFVVAAFRTTLWMLAVVWELDRSREVRANLAVAEERLRFARDLHDVVGRNLSVVALKADLAAQLARRDRSSAAIDEMLEVRRIAHDSLDELRAVVSGYRTADLSVELAGARSLLASAGIDCRVIGEVDISGEPAGALGWAVREGVTNVLRHSEAGTCTITLRGKVLTMSNDGVSPSTFRFGSGLTGLHERIAALGGTVTAAPEAPNRFVLTVELP